MTFSKEFLAQNFVVILYFKRIHDNKIHLLFRATLLHFYFFQIWKNNYFKLLYSFCLSGPVVFHVGNLEGAGESLVDIFLFYQDKLVALVVGKNSPVGKNHQILKGCLIHLLLTCHSQLKLPFSVNKLYFAIDRKIHKSSTEAKLQNC